MSNMLFRRTITKSDELEQRAKKMSSLGGHKQKRSGLVCSQEIIFIIRGFMNDLYFA